MTLPQVRDKDAVSSALSSVELLCYWASQGLTLQERLQQIYHRWGYSTEVVFSKEYEGASGKEKMAAIMANLRKLSVGDELGSSTIASIQDLLDGKQTAFPPSDVLIIRFACGDKLVVRPSGTEPKIKYYLFFTLEEGTREEREQQLALRIQNYKAALS